MERARATWTDERLDDLSRRLDNGFNRVDEDLRQLRTEMSADMNGLRAEMSADMNGLRGEMNELRAEMNGRFDGLQRLMVQSSGAMLIAVLATIVSVLATRG